MNLDYFLSTFLWKYDSQQDLGAKGILTTQDIHKLCKKIVKKVKLTHRNGSNNWVYYHCPICKYTKNMFI